MVTRLKNRLHIELLKRTGKINRITLAAQYICGEGVEIGAMDLPLVVKPGVKVHYLDRCTKEESEKIFPDLKGKLVDVDIIGDGETLEGVKDNSFDFLIANHVLEHCRNPIGTIQNMVRVVKPGGKIFLAIPDKRYTFDISRQITSFEHLENDYLQGPDQSEEAHYLDFVRHTFWGEGKTEAELPAVVDHLKNINFSIHYHVWDHEALMKMFILIKERFTFPYEIVAAVGALPGSNESVFILNKL